MSTSIETPTKDTIRECIEQGNLDVVIGHWQASPLHWAVAWGMTDLIRSRAWTPEQLNRRDGRGYSPLHVAVWEDSTSKLPVDRKEAILLLLDLGSDPNMQGPQRYKGSGWNHDAMRSRHPRAITDYERQTPFFYAIGNHWDSDEEVLQRFIAAGAEVTMVACHADEDLYRRCVEMQRQLGMAVAA